MKTINFNRVSNTLSDNEMKLVKGGAQAVATDGEPANGSPCLRISCADPAGKIRVSYHFAGIDECIGLMGECEHYQLVAMYSGR